MTVTVMQHTVETYTPHSMVVLVHEVVHMIFTVLHEEVKLTHHSTNELEIFKFMFSSKLVHTHTIFH